MNILNDYCEAANAIVSLQKKLSKALKEAAGIKCVGEVPGACNSRYVLKTTWTAYRATCDIANALSASATIFNTLSEVDSKFVKLADKECDSISADVKKWFKRLAVRIFDRVSIDRGSRC